MLASLRQTSPSFMELRPLPNTYTSPWTYGQDLPRVCSRLSWSPSSVLPTHELPPSCSREVPGGSVISGRVAPHKSGAHSWETSKVGSTLVGDRPGTTSRDHTRGRQAKSGAISQDLVWTPGAAPKPPRAVVVDITGPYSIHNLRFDFLPDLAMHIVSVTLRDREFPRCRNQEQGLQELNSRIRRYYNDYKISCRVPDLTMDNLMAKGFPELHGHAVKAANTRHLFKFGAILARELDDGTPEKSRRRVVCESLHHLNQIIDTGPMFLSAEQVQRFRSLCHKIQINMSWLAHRSTMMGQIYWKITPKVHYIALLAEQAALCNPRLVRNYKTESGMGKIQKVYKYNLRGPYSATIQRSVLLKQLMALHSQWL